MVASDESRAGCRAECRGRLGGPAGGQWPREDPSAPSGPHPGTSGATPSLAGVGASWDPRSEGDPGPARQRGTAWKWCFLGKDGAAPCGRPCSVLGTPPLPMTRLPRCGPCPHPGGECPPPSPEASPFHQSFPGICLGYFSLLSKRSICCVRKAKSIEMLFFDADFKRRGKWPPCFQGWSVSTGLRNAMKGIRTESWFDPGGLGGGEPLPSHSVTGDRSLCPP